ncbi:hypothetical protein [Arthrobacter psychrolactophilus]
MLPQLYERRLGLGQITLDRVDLMHRGVPIPRQFRRRPTLTLQLILQNPRHLIRGTLPLSRLHQLIDGAPRRRQLHLGTLQGRAPLGRCQRRLNSPEYDAGHPIFVPLGRDIRGDWRYGRVGEQARIGPIAVEPGWTTEQEGWGWDGSFVVVHVKHGQAHRTVFIEHANPDNFAFGQELPSAESRSLEEMRSTPMRKSLLGQR